MGASGAKAQRVVNASAERQKALRPRSAGNGKSGPKSDYSRYRANLRLTGVELYLWDRAFRACNANKEFSHIRAPKVVTRGAVRSPHSSTRSLAARRKAGT